MMRWVAAKGCSARVSKCISIAKSEGADTCRRKDSRHLQATAGGRYATKLLGGKKGANFAYIFARGALQALIEGLSCIFCMI